MRKSLHLNSRFLLIAAIVLALAFGSLWLFNYLNETHTISIAGEEVVVRGRYTSIAEVIDAAEIDLQAHDYVSPAPDSQPPSSSEPITILRAAPVELILDEQTSTVWTHQTSLASFLAENNLELIGSSRVSIDGVEIDRSGLKEAGLGQSIQISHHTEVTIDDGQTVNSLFVPGTTVGQALIEAGVDIFAADKVDPGVDTRLAPGTVIKIERAAPVEVHVDGQVLDARTKHTNVADALVEAGVGLTGLDETWPPLEEQIGDAQKIEVRRAKTDYQLLETTLSYASRLQPVDTLEIDQRSLVAPGSAGVMSQVTRVETLGSETYSGTVLGEWVAQPAIDEVVGYGTDIVVRTVDTPDGPLSYWRVVRMRVTAYTAADAGRPADHPAYGITASGRMAGYGIVAIDPDVVPFRSQVYVPGYGVAFAGDTGGGVKGRWIDLGYDDGQIQTWSGYVDVYYLTPIPEPDRINYLIPSALP